MFRRNPATRSRLVHLGLAASLGLGLVAAPIALSTSAASAAPCHSGTWSPSAQGRPAFVAGSNKAMYLWHDTGGWHLRVTHPGSHRVVFEGTIDSSRGLGVVTRALEGNDRVVITPRAGKVHFRVENRGGIDGVDFKVDCAPRFTFRGQINGASVSTTDVELGAANTHPTSVPFTMERS